MVKRIVAFVLLALMSIGVEAATEVVDGIEWTYIDVDGKAWVGGGTRAVPTSTKGAITIPTYLGGYRVTRIMLTAFRDCIGLESVTIPNGVTTIDDYAFYGCSGLTSVTIPNSVTSIGYYAFDGCSGLTSVTIPNSVTSIGQYAFFGCSGLTSVTIPDSVTSIGDSAFGGCSGLTSVTIGRGLTSIGYCVFNDCNGLTAFVVHKDNPNYKSDSGLLLTKDGATLVAGVNGAVTIPDSVTRIWYRAFDGCSGLTSVTIPDSVTSIGEGAFDGCIGLTSITIPDSVTSIGSWAFGWCCLTVVEFLGNAPEIANYAFWMVGEYCVVKVRRGSTGWGVEIPGTWSTPGRWEDFPIEYLPDGGCSTYTVVFDANGGEIDESEASREIEGGKAVGKLPVPTLEGYEFFGWYVEEAQIDAAYVVSGDITAVAQWRKLPMFTIMDKTLTAVELNGATEIAIPDGVNSIGYGAFSGCDELISVTIPDGVASIGPFAFCDCSGLASVTFKGSAPTVSANAFDGVADACIVLLPKGNYTYEVVDGNWQGMTVEYYDLEPEPPVIAIDDTKMETPVEVEGIKTIAAKENQVLSQSDADAITIRVTVGAEVVYTTEGYNKTYDPVENKIVITLKEPEVGLAADAPEVEKVEDDATGILVDKDKVVLSTEVPTPTAEETAAGNTDVGALPVKAVKGLYYQASWGDDLGNMRSGEKVQSTGDTLYLGVIKQKGDKGFYKLSVSEK